MRRGEVHPGGAFMGREADEKNKLWRGCCMAVARLAGLLRPRSRVEMARWQAGTWAIFFFAMAA